MAKKNRNESNKRFSYIGSGAKYTLELNGDELNIIAGALHSLINNISKAMKLTPAQYMKNQGHFKEDRRLNDSLKRAKKLQEDLNLYSQQGYFYK